LIDSTSEVDAGAIPGHEVPFGRSSEIHWQIVTFD
jgi:hypothetical protein